MLPTTQPGSVRAGCAPGHDGVRPGWTHEEDAWTRRAGPVRAHDEILTRTPGRWSGSHGNGTSAPVAGPPYRTRRPSGTWPPASALLPGRAGPGGPAGAAAGREGGPAATADRAAPGAVTLGDALLISPWYAGSGRRGPRRSDHLRRPPSWANSSSRQWSQGWRMSRQGDAPRSSPHPWHNRPRPGRPAARGHSGALTRRRAVRVRVATPLNGVLGGNGDGCEA